MAGNAKKTEHAGAKHGNGAYWGRKADAKRESNKMRRLQDRAWEHAYEADSDGFCRHCGQVGSYIHTEPSVR